ncbi:MAG: MBL fold metallo-hydrolase [Bacteroidales bacterium]|jgi:glyoxylase-like metal-dependent hydrolase (beta-lactamase superfamily II)|nr:MBL fold metallo-hydrolase [Bacteroidales bacterium]
MKVNVIETENFKVDGGAMFGVIPKTMWNKVYPADENNMCNLANRCLLIETDQQLILVDAGIGDKHDEKFLSHICVNGNGNLQKSLKKAGYNPNDITDVIFTHLHWDHCAGATYYDEQHRLNLTFPTAHYWVSKSQWEWALNPNAREKAAFQNENLLPLEKSGNLHFIEKNSELFKNIEVRIYNGHTIGMISLIIHGQNQTLALPADLIPTVSHIPLPWISAYDIQPMVLLKEKMDFLSEAYEKKWALFFEHDINGECCFLEKTNKGIKGLNLFPLNQINL